MFVAPGDDSFRMYSSKDELCDGCDILVSGRWREASKAFVNLDMNDPARVFVLLAVGAAEGLSKSMDKRPLKIENFACRLSFYTQYTAVFLWQAAKYW